MSQKESKNSRRKTIGQSPLDSLLSPPTLSTTKNRRTRAATKNVPDTSAESRSRSNATKVRATFHLPADLVDECRNAAVWLAGPPERLTMARLAEDALRRELDRLRQQHTKGKPFPLRSSELRGGRPIGNR